MFSRSRVDRTGLALMGDGRRRVVGRARMRGGWVRGAHQQEQRDHGETGER